MKIKILLTVMLCGMIEVVWGIYYLDFMIMINGMCLNAIMSLCVLSGLFDEDDDNNS